MVRLGINGYASCLAEPTLDKGSIKPSANVVRQGNGIRSAERASRLEHGENAGRIGSQAHGIKVAIGARNRRKRLERLATMVASHQHILGNEIPWGHCMPPNPLANGPSARDSKVGNMQIE